MPSSRLVIIGAGIVGCSVAYHLAKRGWRDVLVIDQGPLFHTGGSTSHAPGGLSLISGSRFLMECAKYALPFYAALEVGGTKGAELRGGLEVATSVERWQELKRRAGWARSFGIDAYLLTAKECREKMPLLNTSGVFGGLFSPGAGIGRPLVACEAMASDAGSNRAVEFRGGVRVTGISETSGRITGVRTTNEEIEADNVLVAAGIWGPLLARPLGITLPLQPMEHLYTKVGPIPELGTLGEDIALPIIRAHDYGAYCRMHGDMFGFGSYHHRPLPLDAHQIEPHAVSPNPSKRLYTPEHGSYAMDGLRRLFPAIKHKPVVDAFNGLFSFTPDGMPLLGPDARYKNLWFAEAVWITHGAGVGRIMADWLVDGHPPVDVREAHVNRFPAHALTRSYIRERGCVAYANTHAIVHPAEPLASPRDVRRSPLHQKYVDQKAVFMETAGWERAAWCEDNAHLLGQVRWRQRTGWEARHWSPLQMAEHIHTRAEAALYDLSHMTKTDVEGPQALNLMQHACTGNMDVPSGKVVYTLMCDPRGGIRADANIVRLDKKHFRVFTSAGGAPLDQEWLRDLGAAKGFDATVRDVTSQFAILGLWGPNAAALARSVWLEEANTKNWPRFSAKHVEVDAVPAVALKVSYVGEAGYEIHVASEYASYVWDRVWEKGMASGIIAAGTHAMDSLRIERGYRRLGFDIHGDIDPFAAGLGFTVDFKKGDFVGSRNLLQISQSAPTRSLRPLTFDDPDAVALGREPILLDAAPVGYVTSANVGYSIGRHIAYGIMPAHLPIGQSMDVEYFGSRLRATIASDPILPRGV